MKPHREGRAPARNSRPGLGTASTPRTPKPRTKEPYEIIIEARRNGLQQCPKCHVPLNFTQNVPNRPIIITMTDVQALIVCKRCSTRVIAEAEERAEAWHQAQDRDRQYGPSFTGFIIDDTPS